MSPSDDTGECLRDRTDQGAYWDRLQNECSWAFGRLPESLSRFALLLAACAIVEAIHDLAVAVRELRQVDAETAADGEP